MRITVRSGRMGRVRGGVQVFAALEGEQRPARLLPDSTARDQELKRLVAGSGFRGAPNEVLFLPRSGGGQWVIVVGLGKEKELSLERVRPFGGAAARAVRARRFKALAVPVLRERGLGTPAAVAQALVEGVLLGLYQYTKLKRIPKSEQGKRIDAVTLVVERAGDAAQARQGAGKAEVIAEAVTFARDLINGPSNIVTPTYLANEARRIAKTHRLSCTVLPFSRLKRL